MKKLKLIIMNREANQDNMLERQAQHKIKYSFLFYCLAELENLFIKMNLN
jgi:hypothetical protein